MKKLYTALVILGLLIAVPLGLGLAREDSEASPSVPEPFTNAETLRPALALSIKNDTSPPLRELAALYAFDKNAAGQAAGPAPSRRTLGLGDGLVEAAVAKRPDAMPAGIDAPAPILSFEGINQNDNLDIHGLTPLPPDANGDVGPNHYVQMANVAYAIWDKSGNLVLGPLGYDTIWTGFAPCDGVFQNPIVLYDHLADRWLLSQTAWDDFFTGPYYECVAISKTGDPTGEYHRYVFQTSADKLNTGPKFGVWTDGYYMSNLQNEFNADADAFDWAGQGVRVFERDQMLNGDPAQQVSFDLFTVDPIIHGLLPADLDGVAPPVGSPNYFAGLGDDLGDPSTGWASDRLNIYEFHVDWTNPANSTFGVAGNPNVALNTDPFSGSDPFNTDSCAGPIPCIPQPDTSQTLDPLSDRLMYRLQYRNFGTHETMVVNHTVDAGSGRAGIRWYELRDSGGGWGINQQSTYAPADSEHRWMGSIAMDGDGNMALGYSVSSADTFPSIRYSGRLSGDPLGTLPQAETELIAGGGSQTTSDSNRWGSYSMMAVDEVDDCAFWYTQEYYPATTDESFHTRIGSFKYPSCPAPPTGTLKVAKDVDPDDANTNWNIDVSGPTSFSETIAGDGMTSQQTVDTGSYIITETAGDDTDLADYSTTFACSGAVTNPSGAGAAINVTVGAGEDVLCTFTNTRKTGTLKVAKDVDPDDPNTNWNIDVSGPTSFSETIAGDGMTSQQTVDTGSYTITETAGDDTDLADYSTTFACSGAVTNPSGAGAAINVTVGAGEDVVCTFTNTRKALPPPGCPDDVLISNYQTVPGNEQFVEIANVGSGPIILSGCSLVTFDVFKEQSIGAATTGLSGDLDRGQTTRVNLTGMPTGPGAMAIYDTPPAPDGTKFSTDNEITGMVYLSNENVFAVGHLTVPAHNAIYECIYGKPPDNFPRKSLNECFTP